MDVVAATALSTGGTWPALLLTDLSEKPPQVVEDYLLDVKPGYELIRPSRSTHGWVIGDDSIISVDEQARLTTHSSSKSWRPTSSGSEEHIESLDLANNKVTPEDIRELTGAVTPTLPSRSGCGSAG